jgi:carbon storage regulator CsrA
LLSLARRPGQKIRIGEDIILVVREIRGRQVKIGIEAPAHVRVLREEIYEELSQSNRASVRERGALPEAILRLDWTHRSIPLVADRLVSFPEGVPGLAEKRFSLVQEKSAPFVDWLQSVDDPQVALILLDPLVLDPAYSASPKPAELRPIRDELSDEPIASRVVARQDQGELILNLFAPMLFNFARKLAMQVPLVGSGHGMKELWPPKPKAPESPETPAE